MRDFAELVYLSKYCLELGPDGGRWQITFKGGESQLRIIASWGGGWDHVSVSLPDRCPTWDEMNFVKDQFFGSHETVMQLHPAKQNYVNCHPFCLHLWKPHQEAISLPPTVMV